MKSFIQTLAFCLILFAIISCEKKENTPVELVCNVTSTNVTVYGGNDGSITINVTKGNGDYLYKLNGIDKANNVINGLSAGTYNVYVTDKESKEFTTSVIITQPQPSALTATVTSQTNVTCYGRSTGSFTILASGATGNYEYKLDNGSYQSSGTFNSLIANTYIVTVKSGAVTTTKSVTITQPNQLSLSHTVINPTLIDGYGQIVLTASGGTSPYEYSRNGISSYQPSNILYVQAGIYNVIVKDGCSDTKTINGIVISNPLKPSIEPFVSSSFTATKIKLDGSINPNGYTTNITINYGINTISENTSNLGSISGTNLTSITTTLNILPNATYNYRIVATSSVGTSTYNGTFKISLSIGSEIQGGIIFRQCDNNGYRYVLVVQKTDYSDYHLWNWPTEIKSYYGRINQHVAKVQQRLDDPNEYWIIPSIQDITGPTDFTDRIRNVVTNLIPYENYWVSDISTISDHSSRMGYHFYNPVFDGYGIDYALNWNTLYKRTRLISAFSY